MLVVYEGPEDPGCGCGDVAEMLRLRRCCGDVLVTVSEHENVAVIMVSELVLNHDERILVAVAEMLRRCCGLGEDTVSEHENVAVMMSEHENVVVIMVREYSP